MSGSQKNSVRHEALKALKGLEAASGANDYVWDGLDEDDRPASVEELQAGLEGARRKRGRPAVCAKVSTTIRFDAEIVDFFRAAGPGWQSRMNSALRDWMQQNTR